VVSVAYRIRQSIASNVLFAAVGLTLDGARFRAKFWIGMKSIKVKCIVVS